MKLVLLKSFHTRSFCNLIWGRIWSVNDHKHFNCQSKRPAGVCGVAYLWPHLTSYVLIQLHPHTQVFGSKATAQPGPIYTKTNTVVALTRKDGWPLTSDALSPLPLPQTCPVYRLRVAAAASLPGVGVGKTFWLVGNNRLQNLTAAPEQEQSFGDPLVGEKKIIGCN